MMVFLADDIFVSEIRGVSRPLTNISIILKLKLSWVFPKFVSRNGILEKSQLRYFFESEQKLKYRLQFFSRNPGQAYFDLNLLITLIFFSIYKAYYISNQKQKKVDIFKTFKDEVNNVFDTNIFRQVKTGNS